MKLAELLLETTSEDSAIIQLATFINGIYFNRKKSNSIPLGFVGNYIKDIPEKYHSVFGNSLDNIEIILDKKNTLDKNIGQNLPNGLTKDSGVQGYWQPLGEPGEYSDDPIKGEIHLNLDRIGETKYIKYIAHEIRHALDDAKSQGRASDSLTYTNPRHKNHYTDDLEYLASPAEINARFTEIIECMERAIPIIYKLPPDKIKPRILHEIYELFDKFNISILFPEREKSPHYKRLMNRAMQFVQNKMNEYEEELIKQNRQKHATGNW